MRNTSGQRDTRRSHHKVKETAITTDEKGVPHLRHRASAISGTYRGRQVLDVDKKLMKKESKRQAREKTEDKK